MSNLNKLITISALTICFVIYTFAFPIFEKGYDLYNETLDSNDIESIISDIRNRDNYVSIEDVSSKYLDALIKSEDKRFFYHNGIDPISLGRAVYNDIRAMKFVQGGSTITQQLAKNLFFSFEKKMERKVAEGLMAIKLEKELSKSEILELYINIIYFGENCYGIKEASNHYYGKNPNDLTENQIDALVYTIKSPNNYNPNKLDTLAKEVITRD